MTGISQDTLRDWRKRDMFAGYGAPLPNGYWGYSMEDAMKVHIAKDFTEAGFEWRDALWIGNVVGGYLTGASLCKGTRGGKHYEAKYLAFYHAKKGERPEHRTGDDLSFIVQRAFEGYAPSVVHVVDLHWTFINLPDQFRNSLVALEG